MQIIVKKNESSQRIKEYADQTRKHYYNREIRDGSRFKSKAGTKEQINRVLQRCFNQRN